MSKNLNPLKWTVRFLIPALVVATAVLVARTLIRTAPQAERRPPPPQQALVETMTLIPTNLTLRLPATGTVMPSRGVQLRSQVAGRVLDTAEAFLDGGFFREGDELLRIDPADYELAVNQARATLAEAEFQWKLEQGRQDVARREWSLIGDAGDASDLQRDLALRKPHLENAEAAVEAARAALALAELNLERTRIVAPFDATVLDRRVNEGAVVSTQDVLANLAATDAAWIEVSLPVRDLRRLTIPREPGEPGSAAVVRMAAAGADHAWTGSVLRLVQALDEQARLARLIVAVPDPLGLDRHDAAAPLLLGSFVRVVLVGETLPDALVIPRTALHDADTVWVMSPDNTLEIRSVEVEWRGEHEAVVRTGLAPGDRVVLSNLGAPVPGMNLVEAPPR